MKSLLGNVLQVRSNYSTWILSTWVIQLGRILIIVKNHNLCHLCIYFKLIEALWCICKMCLMSNIIYVVYCCRVVVIAADLIIENCLEGYFIKIEIWFIVYILSKAYLAWLITISALKEIRISIQWKHCPWTRRILLQSSILPVSRFCLLQIGVNIYSVVEVIVIKGVMFKPYTCEPSCFSRLYQNLLTDCNVLWASSFKQIICYLTSYVINIC